ncbi:MAG: thiamine-phosphate kinase, partial [Bacteroidota bacterium]|nr:thiamine-phosphate kinase [Bacteroidota bacterium]
MENNGNALTPISELGEFALIDQLLEDFIPKNSSTIFGGGDDAAVLKYGEEFLLISTDSYVEGVHFDLAYTPLQHLGYKCITGSISDIYAMNGRPGQVTVALALSSRFTVESVEEIYKGIRTACDLYSVDLVGGDTTSSRAGLVINVTAIGNAVNDKIAYRNGANEHDVICVSGDLGAAYIGLQILEREKRVFLEQPDMQPELQGFDYVLRRQLRPEARKDVIQLL